jgi:hypothetical protein
VVGHKGATLAALLPAGGQHELLHDELRAAIEQLGKRFAAIWSLKNVILFDPEPRLPAGPAVVPPINGSVGAVGGRARAVSVQH